MNTTMKINDHIPGKKCDIYVNFNAMTRGDNGVLKLSNK